MEAHPPTCGRKAIPGAWHIEMSDGGAKLFGTMFPLSAGIVPRGSMVEDRLAILNLLGIYGAYANDGDFEGWIGLFADDATFEITLLDNVFMVDKVQLGAGERHIFSVYRQRLADKGERRLFLLMNPHVRAQGTVEAEVGMTMILVRVVPDGPLPRIESTGTYRGTLVKRGDRWLIHRWHVQTDRAPEPLLETPAHPEAAWER